MSVLQENYGLDVIDVRDNGSGISRSDAINMARPHYTSKLGSFQDLGSLQSYGFRGEALSSIAAVASLQVTTCTTGDDVAHIYTFNHAGGVTASIPSAMGPGTTVHVKGLFKNVPVRRQYFKSVRRCREELKRVEDLMMAFGIANSRVRLVLKHDKCVVWQKIQTEDYSSNLAIVFGSCITQHLTEVTFSREDTVRVHITVSTCKHVRCICGCTVIFYNIQRFISMYFLQYFFCFTSPFLSSAISPFSTAHAER